jgi:hypothetical protein
VLEQPFPAAVGGPPAVVFVNGLPRAEASGQLMPMTAGDQLVNDSVDYLVVVLPAAAAVVALG